MVNVSVSNSPVAVIGAGVAGLAAAHHLAGAGRRVIILEARNRPGGRILTHHSSDGSATVELGAEFVHGRPPATLSLLREAGVGLSSLNGDHWLLTDGRLEPMDDSSGDLHELLALARTTPTDRSVASFLDEVTRNPALREAADWMGKLLEGFDAADPARASLKTIVEEWSGDASTAAEQGRPDGGYGRLVDYMVRRLDPSMVELRLGTPVTRVRWSPSGVKLYSGEAGGASIEASAAVITVPLSILQLDAADSSAIRFDPPLDAKAPALAGLAMGPVLRVMLRFLSPVWEDQLGGQVRAGTFLHAPDQPFRTFWTGDPGSPWLAAWCGGPPAARLGALPDAILMGQAIESARALFAGIPGRAPEPVEAQFHNWQRDPWSQGAYTYVTVGGSGARKALAEPLGGVLFFAGEATETTGEAATVAGAIMSGERAAREVVSSQPDLAADSVGP